MEHEVERLGAGVVLRGDLRLDLAEQLGTQLHSTGLVDTVDVAEGEGRDVTPLLTETQRLHSLVDVGEGRVESFVRPLMLYAVLLAADDADLDLEDGVDGLHAGEQILRDLDVLREGNSGAVPHVGLEDRVATGLDLFLRSGDQRLDEARECVLGAVVGVQGDGDRVVLGDLGGEARERESARGASLHRVAGEVVGATGGDLDDAVGAGLGQALEDGVDRLRAGDVECGVREAAGLRAVEHFGVLIRGGDGHENSCDRGSRDSCHSIGAHAPIPQSRPGASTSASA